MNNPETLVGIKYYAKYGAGNLSALKRELAQELQDICGTEQQQLGRVWTSVM